MNPFGIEPTRIDPIELARWNTANRIAIDTYHAEHALADTNVIDYAARTAASRKQVRYRARKKAQK